MKHRIICFDIARSLLMLWIIGLWHLSNYTTSIPEFLQEETSRLVTIGVLATFTFISGYLAALYNDGMEINIKNLLCYYWRRFIRLYPLYLGAIILFYVLGILTKEELMPSIFMYFEFTNNAPITIWYIGLIFLFYFLAPFISAIENNL